MKIINLGRGQGKTIRLLYASEWNDIPILCASSSQKEYLIDMAKSLGLNIPEPITAWDLTSATIKTKNILKEKDMYVDEAHWVLQSLLKSMGMRGELKAVTFTSDELNNIKQGF